MSLNRRAIAAWMLAVTVLLGGCERTGTPPPATPTATEPTQAVKQLVEDLRRNDLAGYARHAVPPALHARLETAWSEGRTRWPLTELPLDDRLPAFLTALAAPNAEKQLLATYQRQFSGANAELRSAAATLGLFATQYLKKEGDYSADERAHYVQLVAALSRWGQSAPLGDVQRARKAIPQLVAAARQTGLAGGPERFQASGMDHSLERLGPFFARFKQVLAVYGLDLDAGLAATEATVVEHTGDRARVQLRYTLAGQAIQAELDMQRIDGRWYLRDALRHAESEASRPAVTPPPAATPPPAG